MSKEVTNGKLIIYTDGGCINNGDSLKALSGYGVHMVAGTYSGKHKQILGKYVLSEMGYELKTRHSNQNTPSPLLELKYCADVYGNNVLSNTNNQAELEAVIYACKYIDTVLEKVRNEDINIKEVLFLSDSTYTLGFMKKILDNQFDIDKYTTNIEFLERLDSSLTELSGTLKITYGKVPAHEDDLGNNQADLLATIGININDKTENKTKFLIVKDNYWKNPVIDNDLFFFTQLFNFYPDDSVKNKTYYGLNYKAKDDLGKKMSNVTYTILKLDSHNDIVNGILNIMRDRLGNNHFPYVIYINELINKNLLRNYLRYGKDYLVIQVTNCISIKTVKKTEVARVLQSTGLSNVIMDKALLLENNLLNYINNQGIDNVEYIDITDKVFIINEKEKLVLNPDILNDKYIIKYKHNKNLLKIRPKLDLPNRNILKRMDVRNPKVILAITDHRTVYEYNTILSLDGKDTVYTSNIYANKVIKKL